MASIFVVGCETTPPPEGFHYETYTVGKHPERRVVKDYDVADNQIAVAPTKTVPTSSIEPGPGEHYEYQYRGRYISKVVKKDIDENAVPVQVIEVPADERCPKCHWDYVTVGKRSVIKWFCDAKVHGVKEGAEKKEGLTP
ncbi:MAG TPA: hypothetical protein VMU54_05820 [Planctomycetota bacterium]|nr:hypothetical protein [Planctomycetota bacterium]